MHVKHGIDRGTKVTEGSGAWGGYPGGSGVPPPPAKLQRRPASKTLLYCPWFSAFGSASFQSVLPIGLFNCSQPSNVPTGLSE